MWYTYDGGIKVDGFEKEFRSIFGDYPPVCVILSCSGDKVPETEVAFENVESNVFGEDVLTFVCPQCGQIHKSVRLG